MLRSGESIIGDGRCDLASVSLMMTSSDWTLIRVICPLLASTQFQTILVPVALVNRCDLFPVAHLGMKTVSQARRV